MLLEGRGQFEFDDGNACTKRRKVLPRYLRRAYTRNVMLLMSWQLGVKLVTTHNRSIQCLVGHQVIIKGQ
jgi:hypothetical protein